MKRLTDKEIRIILKQSKKQRFADLIDLIHSIEPYSSNMPVGMREEIQKVLDVAEFEDLNL